MILIYILMILVEIYFVRVMGFLVLRLHPLRDSVGSGDENGVEN